MIYKLTRDVGEHKKGDKVSSVFEYASTTLKVLNIHPDVVATWIALGWLPWFTFFFKPAEGEYCWQLKSAGLPVKVRFEGCNDYRHNFLGSYRSEAEAIEVRDKVREYVKTLKK